MKALVVDDEKLIVKGLKFSLEQDGYEVDCAYDGQEAIDKARDKEYDIMLLDLMLPVFDGYQVCQQVREFSDVPIIMLTAKGEDMDKILGLEYGADDYITKPFNILEVKARIKAIIRRNRRKTPAVQEEPKVIVSGSMRLDIDAKRLYIDDKEIRLTVKEFDILKLLHAAAEVALHDVIVVYALTDLGLFLIGEILHASVRVDAGHLKNLIRAGSADTVDVGEADLYPLVFGQVNAGYTCHLSQSFLSMIFPAPFRRRLGPAGGNLRPAGDVVCSVSSLCFFN